MMETRHSPDDDASQLPPAQGSQMHEVATATQSWGFRVMAGVLLLTAGLKTMSLVFPTAWLNQYNAVFPITERWVLILAVTVDIGVAAVLLSPKFDDAIKRIVGGWLLGMFTLYRLGLYWLGNPEHCGCVGNPSAWWPWLQANGASVSLVLYITLLALYAATLSKNKNQDVK